MIGKFKKKVKFYEKINKPNKTNPVDAAAEKYNFFLDSFFWFNFTLFSKTLTSVLFEFFFGLISSKYLAINFLFTEDKFKLEFFTTLFNLWYHFNQYFNYRDK